MADSNSTSPDDATLKLARCLESMTPSQVGFFTRLVQRLETDHYNALIAALKRDLPMIISNKENRVKCLMKLLPLVAAC